MDNSLVNAIWQHSRGRDHEWSLNNDVFLLHVSGALYGTGIYVAVNAFTSIQYAPSNGRGEQRLLLCRALIGRHTQENHSDHAAPKRGSEHFDSASGGDESIFVVFDDRNIYPKYEFTFSKSSEQ